MPKFFANVVSAAIGAVVVCFGIGLWTHDALVLGLSFIGLFFASLGRVAIYVKDEE